MEGPGGPRLRGARQVESAMRGTSAVGDNSFLLLPITVRFVGMLAARCSAQKPPQIGHFVRGPEGVEGFEGAPVFATA